MIIQGMQSTMVKPSDTDLEDKIKTNELSCTTMDPSTINEDKFTPIYSDASPSHQSD